MNNLQRALENGQREDQVIQDKGWQKKSKGQSAAKLGAKHTARVAAKRAIKDMVGNNLAGSILAMIASQAISKIK